MGRREFIKQKRGRAGHQDTTCTPELVVAVTVFLLRRFTSVMSTTISPVSILYTLCLNLIELFRCGLVDLLAVEATAAEVIAVVVVLVFLVVAEQVNNFF